MLMYMVSDECGIYLYICIFVHVVLYIHVIFVYGWHQKNRENYGEIFYLKYVLISGINFSGSK